MKRLITVLFIVALFMPLVVQAAGTYPINYRNVSNPRSLTDLLLDRFKGVDTSLARSGIADPTGTVYWVDGNRSTAGNGLTFDTAFNTLSAAMAASHANIAVTSRRKWASRNTIFVIADEIEEDLTTMAQKTDIIGLGSNDGYPGYAEIRGTWIVPSTVSYPGCRFYNMMFVDAGATPIWDVDGQYGLEFHNCIFNASAASTGGILASECSYMKVDNCRFEAVSSSVEFDTYGIKIENDTNAIYGVRILNSFIQTAGIGIDWDETESYNCIIDGCTIRSTGLWVDEEGDGVIVQNNIAYTAVDCDTSTAGYDFLLANAANNLQIASGGTDTYDQIPYIAVAESP